MKRWKVLLTPLLVSCFLGLSCLASCEKSQGGPLTADEKMQIEAEARQMLNEYYASICSEGLLAEFDFLDSSKDFHWQPLGADHLLYYDSVASAIRRNARVTDSICIEWTELSINALAADPATYVGKMRSWIRSAAGDTGSTQAQ